LQIYFQNYYILQIDLALAHPVFGADFVALAIDFLLEHHHYHIKHPYVVGGLD